MKKISDILWKIFLISILLLIAALVFSKTDVARWRALGMIMPITSLSFWGALIVMIIDYFRKDK